MDNKNKNSLKIENEKNYTLKHRFAMGALVSLFLSFTVLLCGPLTLYIEGANDLWFTFLTLLKPVLLIFVIGFVIFTLLTSLPPKTFHKIICSLFFILSTISLSSTNFNYLTNILVTYSISIYYYFIWI